MDWTPFITGGRIITIQMIRFSMSARTSPHKHTVTHFFPGCSPGACAPGVVRKLFRLCHGDWDNRLNTTVCVLACVCVGCRRKNASVFGSAPLGLFNTESLWQKYPLLSSFITLSINLKYAVLRLDGTFFSVSCQYQQDQFIRWVERKPLKVLQWSLSSWAKPFNKLSCGCRMYVCGFCYSSVLVHFDFNP